MPTKTALRGDLVVSSKILGHISEGLYRGPAGVLKELVSNSFDANARTVWISTGRPTFDVVSVRDDGDGMSLQKFLEIVSGGIGDSDKRVTDKPLINGRQVIGRLGIGILGVSQISHEFSVVSHVRESREAFRAVVSMRDFRRDILAYDDDGEQEADDDGEDETDAEGEKGDGGFPVGGFEAEEIEFDEKRAGLTITAIDPTEGFRRQLAEDKPGPMPREFREFIESSRKKNELAEGSLYNRMIWQLASLVPIPYLADSTVSDGDKGMAAIAEAVGNFDFTVIVDGVKLFRPALMDGPVVEVGIDSKGEGDGPFQFPLGLDTTVWGTRLVVKGYLYGSAGSALHPEDIRGLLIRLRHVGIGEYDTSLLGYRFAEGPRYAWLSGELFVEQGIEDALTVGRDGFDAGHPHYIELRSWIHNELRSRVFPALYRGIKSRRIKREAIKLEQRETAFLESIRVFAGMPLEVRDVADRSFPPVKVDLQQGVVSINSAVDWPRGRRQRDMAQKLSVIFELVRVVDTDRNEVEEFINLSQKLLTQQ